MNRRTFIKGVPAFTMMAASTKAMSQNSQPASPAPAETTPTGPVQGMKSIELVKPEMDGGKSVLAALKERRTNRNIRDEQLSPQMLSNLMWAAFGVNRPDTNPPGRTAASASNSQEIDLYAVLQEGIYLYEAAGHQLIPVVSGDQRAKVSARGRQGAMAKAPVNIIFVADIAKFSRARFQEPGLKDPEIQKSYYNVATGLIAGNIYLFAASQGLAAWFHNCDKPGLTEILKLRPQQRVLYGQTVGYPA